MNKVVVTGGRSYPDHATIWNVLHSLKVDTLYVGDATGADEHAREWASVFDIQVKVSRRRNDSNVRRV